MLKDDLTVVIFTSPIPSHPSDWILDNVYQSIRHQLPDCRILILADGVPVNFVESPTYTQFKHKVRSRGRELIEFSGWHHETLMLKYALTLIKTPLVLVCEGDWGFRELPIDWETITEAILDPLVPYSLAQIRQTEIAPWEIGHFGALLSFGNIDLLQTNWFQCPNHIATCDWYRRIVAEFTMPEMLEHNQMELALKRCNAYEDMACYIPKREGTGRLYHLNGRHAIEPYHAGGMFVPKG